MSPLRQATISAILVGGLLLIWEIGGGAYTPKPSTYVRRAINAMDNSLPKRPATAKNLAVPFIHQLWDTPSTFNGRWACGPTSVAMVLAYYGLLKPNPVPVKAQWHPTKSSLFGRYISDEFNHRGHVFNLKAKTPSGSAAGLYGTTLDNHPGWMTGPYITNKAGGSRGIAAVMQIFGLGMRISVPKKNRYFTANDFAAQVVPNIDRLQPVIVGGDVNGLGHVIVIRGYWRTPGGETIYICNDPFGRGTTGRREYSGADVDYSFKQINPRWMCLIDGGRLA